MPKEQLRTAILLATRDVLHEVVDEAWTHLDKSTMRKVRFAAKRVGDLIRSLRLCRSPS
jgi:ABC-type ATPase with predicted acetyltransferase domain